MTMDVLRAATRLDDDDGVERFLAGMPKSEALRPMLKPGRTYRAEQYDKDSRTARYLLADGVWLVCFVVTDISLEEARAISRQTEVNAEWSTPNFHKAVQRALGLRFVPRS